jgi:hypothetical protein
MVFPHCVVAVDCSNILRVVFFCALSASFTAWVIPKAARKSPRDIVAKPGDDIYI